MPVIDLGSVVGPQGPQGAAGATGAQGIQGNPGPNQVTDQTSTNLNGVLFGSQSKVTVKPVDASPTADSTNLVSSGGVKTALDGKANLGQIGYLESGTTASRNYSAGEYICWNGLTYTADTNIALGATLSASGGNKNLTECVGGGFNSVRVSHIDYETTSDLSLSPMSNGFYDVTSAIPAGYEPISGKIVAPTVPAQSYLIVWLNEWMGVIRCNVFLIGEQARTVPTGTKIRIFIVKK